jgi:hypothetical protein
MQNLDIVRGDNRIAMLDCENEALCDGDILANARLIAAAPDLLAALEAFELWTDALANAGEMTPDAWVELDKLHQKACSAIDKAKGN